MSFLLSAFGGLAIYANEHKIYQTKAKKSQNCTKREQLTILPSMRFADGIRVGVWTGRKNNSFSAYVGGVKLIVSAELVYQ